MSTSDDDRLDVAAGILADLESLRASRQPAADEEEQDEREGARARLADIAEAAGQLRDENTDIHGSDRSEGSAHDEATDADRGPASGPAGGGAGAARRSARDSVANRGLVFESYIADTQGTADTDDPEDEDDGDTEAHAGPVDPRNPFSHSSEAPAGGFTPFSAPAGGGLLFQAPQEELAQPADPNWFDDGTEQDDDTDEGEQDDTDDASDWDSDDEARGRARRRRGGRGRRSRGRGRDDSSVSDDAVEEAGADSAADSPGEGDGEKQEPSGKAQDEGERRGRRGRKRRGDTKDSDAQNPSGDTGRGESRKDDGNSSNSDSAPWGEGTDKESGGDADDSDDDSNSRRRRRRRARSSQREPSAPEGEVTGVKGSTRLEAKRQRRREGREAGRRRPLLTEAEFLARRESVTRTMLVRETEGRTQLVVLEDGVAVEHYLSEHKAQASLIGNVYLGKVQNVLPSMEAAFIDIGKGRNAVLYAGEVNWDALGMNGKPRRIEQALNPGDSVLVQVTKDPVGHKGARLTSQISLPGRFLVYIPGNSMTGISRKLPDNERARLKKLLKEILPEDAGVIVRTASEGASDEELGRDVERLSKRWESIAKKSKSQKTSAPKLLYSEPDMIVRIIRDVFNEDFDALVVDGDGAWGTIHEYVEAVASDLLDRVSRYGAQGTETERPAAEGTDIFDHFRVSEQVEKALSRKVNLPSGGSLVIDRTEAMTVIDVNTGKFTGSGGNLEETVTKNNLEAAEEVIRQLRLRDIGGIIVVDFIDMVLESNRDLVTRRLVECLSRDRTRHQVAEVTSLGLVQMTRKRIGTGLAESLAAAGEDVSGRGLLPGTEPGEQGGSHRSERKGRKKGRGQAKDSGDSGKRQSDEREIDQKQEQSRSAVAAIAKATIKQDADDKTESDDTTGTEDKSGTGGGGKKGSRSRRARSKPSEPAQHSRPAEPEQPEELAEAAEPEGPAPLMIGAETTTSVQKKPVAEERTRSASRSEPADSERSAVEAVPAEQPEDDEKTDGAPAAPILILGMED